MGISPEECAREILDAIPVVMRSIRSEMRSHRETGMSVPQFRAMLFLRRNPGISLVNVADHLGLTPPSASKLIDGLVARGLVTRQGSIHDRRRIELHLSNKGEQSLDVSDRATRDNLVAKIHALTPDERNMVGQSLQLLSKRRH